MPRALRPDLDAGQRARDHEVVEIAEMADAEHLVGERPEAVAERHVAALEDLGPQLSAECPSGSRTAVSEDEYSAGFRHWISKPQCRTAAPRRLGGAVVAGEDVVEPLLVQHVDRDLQALQQVGRTACRGR